MHPVEILLSQLESHQLQVILVPLNPRLRNYNDGGCKRVLADQNPKWYRQFCARHPSSRGVRRGKLDTRIRRANVPRALRQIIAGKPAGKYEEELKSIAASDCARPPSNTYYTPSPR